MAHPHLNRRRFIQAIGGVAVSAGLAGCGGSSANGGFDTTVRVVNDVPRTAEAGGSEVTPDLTPIHSDGLEITETIFQKAGPKGLVVAGNVENTSDQTFEEILVDATLYDGTEYEDDVLDSTSNQSRHETLESGNLWRWAVKFRDKPEFDTDYYTVTIKGNHD